MALLTEFMQLMEDKKYYEGHEFLEDEWKRLKKVDKKKSSVYKGLINASVSFELYRLKRYESSLKIWAVFEKYMPLLDSLEDDDMALLYRCKSFLIAHNKALRADMLK